MILNVGGSINQVKWETIDKFPKSRLQRLRYAVTEGNTFLPGNSIIFRFCNGIQSYLNSVMEFNHI